MDFPVPIEIPWKLAASTQPLTAAGPNETTISLFYYKPTLETIDADYPDEYLVYLKFTVSISRRVPFDANRIKALMGDGLPVWSLLFDVRVSPDPIKFGGIRPFFIAASPLRRAMIETGVVGVDLYEGESKGVAVGKSASQLHESGSSNADTTTSGVEGTSIWPLGTLGFSTQDTETSSSFDRTVTQRVDTTQREASEERRELLSHHTNVQNVLSLLEAKHLGSPYLRFMVRPRPLRPLAIDPSDPNLWYSQLVARRSAGLEGIQEFFAVVAVPKGTRFCIRANLTRIFVPDKPPSPPDPSQFGYEGVTSPGAAARMWKFLNTVYPAGTPLEELDIDILPEADVPNMPRPVIDTWVTGNPKIVVAVVGSPRPAGQSWVEWNLSVYAYKHLFEVWRDTLRWEYERALAQSPLERHTPFGIFTQLNSCFGLNASGDLVVRNYNFAAHAPVAPRLTVEPADAASAEPPDGVSGKRRQMQRVMQWNAVEQRVMRLLSMLTPEELMEHPLTGAAFVDFVLTEWAGLRRTDSRNEPLPTAAAAIGLSATQMRRLRGKGINDLRGLASAIRDAADIEDMNARQAVLADTFSKMERCLFEFKPVPVSVSSSEARALKAAIARRLSIQETPNRPK